MIASKAQDSFVEALHTGDRRRVVSFAKADRHCHSLFGASLESIAARAGKQLQRAPTRMADLDEMHRYAHTELYAFIRDRTGTEFAAETTICEAIRDGVIILEMSIDSDFVQLYESGASGLAAFVGGLVAEYAPRIDFRPEVGLSKKRDPLPQIEMAETCIETGVFKSIDLYGSEHAQRPEAYVDLFRKARQRGLKLKAHVGEFGDAALVERTLEVLDLDEIQHGVAVATSESLMKQIREKGIRINVCPSSNVALSVVADLGHHPIRALVRNGIRVTVNSDDKTIFGKTVTDEYMGLFAAGTLTAEELEAVRIESLSG